MSIAGTYYATQIKNKFVYYSHSGYRITFLVNAATVSSLMQNVVQIYRIPGPKISALGTNFTTKIVYKWVYYKNIKYSTVPFYIYIYNIYHCPIPGIFCHNHHEGPTNKRLEHFFVEAK